MDSWRRPSSCAHWCCFQPTFDKFVEANWSLHETISPLGRDNLPNPLASRSNPYVPVNQPAIGDLFEMFEFDEHRH